MVAKLFGLGRFRLFRSFDPLRGLRSENLRPFRPPAVSSIRRVLRLEELDELGELWREVRVSQKTVRDISMVLMPLAVMLIAAGCIGGGQPYPADYFPEMHYQAGARYQEPPRLQPPAGSVPTKGTDVPVDPAQIGAMRNPVTRTDATIAKGKTLYMTNCSVCHGQAGKGDGPVAAKFKNANATTLPNDLTLPATQNKADGQIWGIITNGGLNMPRWGTLLTAEERWLLVGYIKSLR